MDSFSFNLDNKPFATNSDPSFLWLGERQREVLATLHHGIHENKGLLLFTGVAGSGKTTLIKALTEGLEKDVLWTILSDPEIERIDFYNAIARGLGIDRTFTSKVQFLLEFSHFLHRSDDENRKVLLLVDDCHRLSQEMLEELRLLSNIEKAGAKLLALFFAGRPEFNEMLALPKNRAMRERLTLKIEVPSPSADEAGEYIRHRLEAAGLEEELFTAKAVQAIYRYSRGIPRQINLICSQALASGTTGTKKTIDHAVIESCVRKMGLPADPSQAKPPTSLESEKRDAGAAGFAPPFGREHRRRWVIYSLGIVFVLAAGLYFWFPSSQAPQTVWTAPVGIAEKPQVKPLAPIGSPPAGIMLEKKMNELGGKKVELKSAILERADGNNRQSSEPDIPQAGGVPAAATGPAGQTHRPAEDAAASRPESAAEPKVADRVAAPAEVAQQKPAVAKIAPLEPRKTVLSLRPNSLQLTDEAQKELDALIEKLKLYPRATVYVKGFVSAKSNSPANIKLSEERAMAVQKLMLGKGIDHGRIKVVGMGNKEPIAANDTSEGRKKNRRVEVQVSNDGT